MTHEPLAIDLFCGLGGWSEALLAEGWRVIGFDIERHQYGDHRYPAQLVIQDVLTLHGSQFRSADLIVASPPCQEFSYMAMPWSRGKAKAESIRNDQTGRMRGDLTRLFDACFRIQAEACEAAGRHIPMIVENVRGAQEWVGRARWRHGSFYLWGDVPALMPLIRSIKNNGGSWFAIGSPRQKVTGQNPVGRKGAFKSTGMNWSDQTKRGQDFTRIAGQQALACIKQGGSGAEWFRDALNERRKAATAEGRKVSGDWFGGYGGGFGWDSSPMRRNSPKSNARKAASAMIAKIPEPLARHIARTFYPSSLLISSTKNWNLKHDH